MYLLLIDTNIVIYIPYYIVYIVYSIYIWYIVYYILIYSN